MYKNQKLSIDPKTLAQCFLHLEVPSFSQVISLQVLEQTSIRGWLTSTSEASEDLKLSTLKLKVGASLEFLKPLLTSP